MPVSRPWKDSEYLEQDLELSGVTGVEDRLQRDVKSSLELLRNDTTRCLHFITRQHPDLNTSIA
jgi:magnesium-transporting ATPase (P-type)